MKELKRTIGIMIALMLMAAVFTFAEEAKNSPSAGL